MPIVTTEYLADVDGKALTNYLDAIGKADGPYVALRFLATINMGPVVFLINVVAHSYEWEKTYVPQKVLHRMLALGSENGPTMLKIIQKRQWPLTHWLKFGLNCGAVILVICGGIGIEIVSRIWGWVRLSWQ